MKKISGGNILFWSGITAVKLIATFALSILLAVFLPVINLLAWLGIRPDSPKEEEMVSWISFGIFWIVIYIITCILFNRATKSLGWVEPKVKKPKQPVPSTLRREDFDKILIEEGILSEADRDEVWAGRPPNWNAAGDEITEKSLRKSAKAFVKKFPDSTKEDPPSNDSG